MRRPEGLCPIWKTLKNLRRIFCQTYKMGSRIQHPGRKREYIVPGKVWPITCLVPRIPAWHLPGSGVLLQGGTLWRSQKDASASETKPFPGPLHPGLYLQTILVNPLPTPRSVIAQKAGLIWQRWSGRLKPFVGCVWTRQGEALQCVQEVSSTAGLVLWA